MSSKSSKVKIFFLICVLLSLAFVAEARKRKSRGGYRKRRNKNYGANKNHGGKKNYHQNKGSASYEEVSLIDMEKKKSSGSYKRNQKSGYRKKRSSGGHSSSGHKSYEMYLFAVSWAPSVCTEKRCSFKHTGSEKNRFNIHGLWPSKYAGESPQFCHRTSRDELNSVYDKQKDLLENKWSGLYSSSQGFLGHEMGKHGSCFSCEAGDISKMQPSIAKIVENCRNGKLSRLEAYLEITIELYKSIDLEKTLKQAQILPKNNRAYPLKNVQNAIGKALKISKFHTYCQSAKKGKLPPLEGRRSTKDQNSRFSLILRSLEGNKNLYRSGFQPC